MKRKALPPLLLLLCAFLACEIVKDFEFLFLRTDQTILAENIICKLFAIALIAFCLKRMGWHWKTIGFQRRGIGRGLLIGISLGVVTFTAAYAIELLTLRLMGLHPRLSFYIANFALANQHVTGGSATALIICLAGNAVNVWSEEGLFRGLLLHLGKGSASDRKANRTQAVLFGLWHAVVPAVWLFDGSIGLAGAGVMAVGYVILAGILGYEWGLCALWTGAVWAGVFEHFFNNFLSNALHVVTETGADELQIIRIVLSNVFSLAIVMVLARNQRRRCQNQNAQRKTAEKII